MIVFDLRCKDGHVFEAWFGSTEDYEGQRARGLVECPLCGSDALEKVPAAPRVSPKGDDSDAKAMLGALAEAQRRMLAGSEHVGDRFASEARAIHLGEADARSIHGRASRADAWSLIADGIAVAPLPLPFVPPGESN